MDAFVAFAAHLITFWAIFWCFAYVTFDHIQTFDSKKCLKGFNRTIVNQVFVTLPFLICFQQVYDFETPFEEGFSSFFGKILVCLFVEEVLFTGIHWALHRYFYSQIHSIHHRWTDVCIFATLDVHPIEHLILNLFPIFAGPLITRLSFIGLVLWTYLATFNAIMTHSGIGPIHHRIHHWRKTRNFSALGILD